MRGVLGALIAMDGFMAWGGGVLPEVQAPLHAIVAASALCAGAIPWEVSPSRRGRFLNRACHLLVGVASVNAGVYWLVDAEPSLAMLALGASLGLLASLSFVAVPIIQRHSGQSSLHNGSDADCD